jgi:hypothetical protein
VSLSNAKKSNIGTLCRRQRGYVGWAWFTQREGGSSASATRGLACGGEFFGAGGFPEFDVGLEFFHHAGELTEFEGLCAVADGFFRGGVRFDDQTVSADGDGGARYGGHEAAFSRGVAGIEDDGKVREFVEYGNSGNVTGVARGGLEGADAAFAEDHFGVAMRGDVFGAHEQLFDAAAQPTLQQNRAATFAERFQEHEVLHIASADLHDVRVVGDEVDVAVTHDFGDDRKARGFFGFLQQFQTFFFQSLKIVWRSARLKGPAAEKFGAGFGHRFRGTHDLLFALHGTRAGNHDKLVAADFRAVHLDARFPFAKFLADEFVGRGNTHDVLDLRHSFHGFEAGRDIADADDADDNTLFAFNRVHFVAETLHDPANLVDFLARSVQLHGDDHVLFLLPFLDEQAQNKKSPLSASGPNIGEFD